MLFSLFPGAVLAGEVPRLNQNILVNARELSVETFLSEVFGQINVPVKVADEITGAVNGDFNGPASSVIHDITSTFQLAVYFDGAVAHVYPSNNLVHKVMYMSANSAKDIKRAAQKLGMLDPHNTVSAADVGLVVTGAQRFVDQVESLAGAMRKTKSSATSKQANAKEIYRSFQLNYAWANDMSFTVGGQTVQIPGVASIVRTIIEPGSLSIPGDSFTHSSSESGQTVALAGGPQKKSTSRHSGVPVENNTSTSNTRIVADPLTNSIIIRDRADRMQSYADLIKTLDKEPQMIEIEATIIDLDTERMRELGINWRAQSGDDEALFGNGSSSDELLSSAGGITPAGEGGWVSLILGNRNRFIARINALEKQGAARIVSKPHVMTLSNVEALLNTTSTYYVRLEGRDEVDLREVTVGTTLRVTPHVYERAGRTQIKLRINISDGSPSSQRVDDLPVIENSEVNTQAIVDVGQSLLIGGLVRESIGNGVSRVPVLGRIPVLGSLFRTRNKSSTRQERMFLITPRVGQSNMQGKRLEAPILSGLEDDILRSAPNRMHNTRQSLDLLDENNPPNAALPIGDTLTPGRVTAIEPFRAIGNTQARAAGQSTAANPDTLRERLLKQHAINKAIAAGSGEEALNFEPITAVKLSAKNRESTGIEANSAEAWQTVPMSTEDGWQAVAQ